MILSFFNAIFDFIMFGLIIANISLRKFKDGQKKRFSTILLALIFLVTYFILILINTRAWPSWLELVTVVLALLVIVFLRKKVWPWKRHCPKCGKKLSWDATLGRDSNLCDDCYYEEHPEEKKKKEEEERKMTKSLPQEKINEVCKNATSINEIPWGSWEADERCVITYVIDEDNVLLIHKKKGLGTGYINAPGGHIEIEETKVEAAIRETKEETGLDITDLKEMGTLYFQFKDGLKMLGYVFTATKWSGELIEECEETKPFWTKINEIDYSLMWADDKLWLPEMLKGRKFEGYFLFDDRTLLDSKIEFLEDEDNE